MAATKEALLTPEQLAETLSVSRPTILRWSRENLIPVVSVGKMRRYRLSDVERNLTK